MKKPHLVLVHSFPTNSILLHGLVEFLDDYFEVHFIDLPGFHKDVPALKGSITIKKFSDYLDKKIEELDVKEYIVAGISFGFLVVNNAKLDKRCKAVLAVEPFVNSQCLNISFWTQKKYIIISFILQLLHTFKLEKGIWKSNWFNKYLQKEAGCSKDSMDKIIDHLDPPTFFAVINLLMNYKKYPKFHNLPYFLIGNFTDKIIDFSLVLEIFSENLHELHVISDPIDHFPKDLSKKYFESCIPKEHITRMIACMKENS
ncbi:hypothetical protein HXX01_00975 [Candidatus Nomurabacteria bacterium]|nr:hypothetical protein [Candidatus Nomurabacteria bacterium]